MVIKKQPKKKVIHRRRVRVFRRRGWTEEDEKRELYRREANDRAVKFLEQTMNDEDQPMYERLEAAKIIVGYW